MRNSSLARVCGPVIAVLLAGAGFGLQPLRGQTPRPAAVRVTSGGTVEPLPLPSGVAPPSGPARLRRSIRPAAVAGYDVHRWLDRTEAPETVAPLVRSTVVLGRDLLIANRSYRAANHDTPGTPVLVLVADRLRIGPNATVDVTPSERAAKGGKVILMAREIVCEPGGLLQVIANGTRPHGAGGSVVVAGTTVLAESPARRTSRDATMERSKLALRNHRQLVVPAAHPCIRATVNGAPEVVVRKHSDARTGAPPPERTIPAGAAGRFTVSPDLRATAQADDDARVGLSLWTLEKLEALSLAIYDASHARSMPQLLRLFREYESSMLFSDLMVPAVRDGARSLLADLNRYRENALPPLSVEEVSVRPGGLPQLATVFTEGATLRASLAPSHALAIRANVAGRPALGLIEYRNERPDEIVIEVEFELTVDPWIERLAAEQLTAIGQRLDGIFGGWALEAKPMQELGVRGATAVLLPGGRRLRLRLVADVDRANLVFWRLNGAGLPWTVEWRFTEPKTGRVVTGTWAGPALSLMHRRDPLVIISGDEVVNNGTSAAVVNYVRLGDGSFVALNPSIHVGAGDRRPLPLALRSGVPLTVPAEAVEIAFNPDTFTGDFYVLNGTQVVDRIIVTNNLPTSDDARGPFDYLEITVSTGIKDGSSDDAVAGPFRLSARGTRAAEISIPFLRLSRGARQVLVEGRAYYVGGSFRTLRPTSFDTTAITVTQDMFQ